MIQLIDLTQEINDWKDAICGEEVRAANVSAFEKIQGIVNETVHDVNIAAETAQKASEDVIDAIALANRTLSEAVHAEEVATEKAEIAVASARDAEIAADRAEAYADFIVPAFHVNFVSGLLEYTSSDSITFLINNATGDLEYSYT